MRLAATLAVLAMVGACSQPEYEKELFELAKQTALMPDCADWEIDGARQVHIEEGLGSNLPSLVVTFHVDEACADGWSKALDDNGTFARRYVGWARVDPSISVTRNLEDRRAMNVLWHDHERVDGVPDHTERLLKLRAEGE